MTHDIDPASDDGPITPTGAPDRSMLAMWLRRTPRDPALRRAAEYHAEAGENARGLALSRGDEAADYYLARAGLPHGQMGLL